MSASGDFKVYKYSLPVQDEAEIQMPGGAQVLHVGEQTPGELELWAKVQPLNPDEPRRFRIAGTGHPIEPGLEYLGTVQSAYRRLVWHVFEKK